LRKKDIVVMTPFRRLREGVFGMVRNVAHGVVRKETTLHNL